MRVPLLVAEFRDQYGKLMVPDEGVPAIYYLSGGAWYSLSGNPINVTLPAGAYPIYGVGSTWVPPAYTKYAVSDTFQLNLTEDTKITFTLTSDGTKLNVAVTSLVTPNQLGLYVRNVTKNTVSQTVYAGQTIRIEGGLTDLLELNAFLARDGSPVKMAGVHVTFSVNMPSVTWTPRRMVAADYTNENGQVKVSTTIKSIYAEAPVTELVGDATFQAMFTI